MVAAATLVACGGSQQDVANEFVSATKNRDLATLAEVSTVPLPFEPSEIASWRIKGTSTPREEPFDLEGLQRKLSQARAARDVALAANDEAERLRIQSRVDRLRTELDAQREVARKSLRTWSSIDDFAGRIEIAEVEVSLRAPDGNERFFSLTLEKYSLAHRQSGTRSSAKWIVTRVEPRT